MDLYPARCAGLRDPGLSHGPGRTGGGKIHNDLTRKALLA